MTGAYARTALNERLEEEVQRGLRYGEEFSLLLLDLDNFKSVNDAFGHSRGDAVLAELAARVQSAARASDVLFRYGGDEFVLFLPRATREQAAALARRLADEISATPFAGNPPLTLSASVGVSAFPEDGTTAAALFDRADARMFQAKRGGGRVMDQDTPQRLSDALSQVGRPVERADAVERVNAFLDELVRARRGVLHLSGAHGSGRTRLLREVEHLATLRGHRVVSVRGRPDTRGEPMGALRAACAHVDAAALRPGSPEGAAAFLRRAAAPGRGLALVVTLDDMADVDRASLDVLRALAAGPRRAPCVALVHTAGTGEPDPGPPDVPLRRTVQLHPLSREGVRVWLRAALRAEAGEDLVDWLHAESGGLPGGVHDLLLHLARRGAVTPRADGAWSVQDDFRDVAGRAVPAPPLLRNAPGAPDPLVDRDEALREVLRTLRAARLVTLFGARGAGKTRLALEAAQEAAERFADGVVWVRADEAAEPRALSTALAVALDAQPGGGPELDARLVIALRPLRTLLVIDGMQEPAPCAPLLQRILDGAPDVRLLVTARQRLQLAAEWGIAVEGLAAPRTPEPERLMEYDAVRLFALRAAAVGAAPGSDDLPHVGRLVYALYGLPLAVEIAAAQSAVLSCRELATEVQGALDDLKAYLPAEAPERRVARAVLDVAWRLLPAQLRAALRRASVFRAPFGEEAARRVAAAGVAELDALEQRALLRRTPDGRYRLHGLVRDYARAKLDDFPRERADAGAAYVEYHLARLRELAGVPGGALVLEVELPDLRRAWELAARDGRGDALAGAADALLALLGRRGAWADAEHLLACALSWLRAREGAGEATRRLEARLGAARVRQERPGDAGPPLRRSLAAAVAAHDAAEEAECLVWLGHAHLLDGEPRLARAAAASAVSAADRAGIAALRVRALCAAAESALAGGARREAVECLYEAVEVDPDGAAAADAWSQLLRTGESLLRGGELPLAAVLLSRAVSSGMAPPAIAASAQALLGELGSFDAPLPATVPALVIVAPEGERRKAPGASDPVAESAALPAMN
ncbi:MAG TPA: diguanylate cyclase [Longimicrobium sp.]|nr:diguanylate cyclase [Longimicrobium sp.]